MERLNKFTVWAMIFAFTVYTLTGFGMIITAIIAIINFFVTMINLNNNFLKKY